MAALMKWMAEKGLNSFRGLVARANSPAYPVTGRMTDAEAQAAIEHELDKSSRRARIIVAIVLMLFLALVAAWTASHERTASPGESVDRGVTRCGAYRRCCRPRCRFVLGGSNQWLHAWRW